jgi:hypothetical protein
MRIHGKFTSKADGSTVYEALAGHHIDEACKEVAEYCKTHTRSVSFSFNGIELLAIPGNSAQVLVSYVHEC